MEILANKKTYLIAVAMVAYALLGTFLGYMEGAQMVQLILEALGLIGLRLGISKAQVM